MERRPYQKNEPQVIALAAVRSQNTGMLEQIGMLVLATLIVLLISL